MTDLINLMNDLLWGSILVYLLVGVGIYFTLRLGFIQFRHFTHTFTVLKNSRKADNAGISSFQALCTSLAARVGTGNMAGVAVALTAGGPGAIFWMGIARRWAGCHFLDVVDCDARYGYFFRGKYACTAVQNP